MKWEVPAQVNITTTTKPNILNILNIPRTIHPNIHHHISPRIPHKTSTSLITTNHLSIPNHRKNIHNLQNSSNHKSITNLLPFLNNIPLTNQPSIPRQPLHLSPTPPLRP